MRKSGLLFDILINLTIVIIILGIFIFILGVFLFILNKISPKTNEKFGIYTAVKMIIVGFLTILMLGGAISML